MKKYDFSTDKYNLWATQLIEDVPIICQKISVSCNIDLKLSRLLLIEVLKYLDLVSYTDQKLTPSIFVDDAWHEFILCTKLYDKFCKEKFGRFIHHHPGTKDQKTTKQFKNTIKFYILYLGKPNKFFWGDFSNEEWKQSQCGSCESL